MSGSILELIREGERYLAKQGLSDSRQSSEQLLSHVLGKTRSELYLDSTFQAPPKAEKKFFQLLRRRSGRYPVQYLTGKAHFRNVVLSAKRGTFIPRPETECLVDVALDYLKNSRKEMPRILDIGTGSGNVAVSLAVEASQAEIVATDKSICSLRLAKLNAKKNGVYEKIYFVRTKFWQGIDGKFDGIVSNPPYLSARDLETLQPEVQYEPKCALDGGCRGLEVIAWIIRSVSNILNRGGFVALEVGKGQARAVEKLFKENEFIDVKITKDLSGIERIVSAKRKS